MTIAKVKRETRARPSMHNMDVIGMRGDAGFDDIVNHFIGLGGDVILFDPNMVCGKGQIMSAAVHAERSFEHGYNRSKTLLTEIILYASGERQIGKALKKMRPKKGCSEYVAAVLDIDGDLDLGKIGMTRCDALVEPTPEKAASLGLESHGKDLPLDRLAMEMVAMVDILKA